MKIKTILILSIVAATIYSCEQKDPLQEKKKALKSKKTELHEVRNAISELEKEISSMDPDFAKKHRKATLVTTSIVKRDTFQHYVEVSGSVKSRKNVLISSENMGNIKRINVKEGDEVKARQLIMSMDVELFQRNLDQLETELDLAKIMFEKQSNLWDRNIGTEIQYLEAKNRKESLENQIANINTQISKSQIRAPFAGTIENVVVKEGEMAQIGFPLVRIVNHKDMYIKADLSEAHIGKFKKGSKVIISFPSINKSVDSKISSIGQVIDEMNRTFSIEALLPKTNFMIKPNLLAIVKLKDFEKIEAVVIPTKLIQKDNKGSFVFITKNESDELVAQKIKIDRGVTYKNKTMITDGLTGDEALINEGFRDVADGGKIEVVENIL